MPRPADRRGSVLVLVLWSLIVFSIFSVTLAGSANSRVSAAKAVRSRIVGRALAAAAVSDFRVALADKTTPRELAALLGAEWSGEAGEGSFTYAVTDENSKIDLNHATNEVLSGLPGVDPELAARILEARPYKTVGQLSSVPGIGKELFESLAPHLTVLTNGAVNINTAPDGILKALGFSDNLIGTVREIRRGPDGEAGTEDDALFDNVDQILNLLRTRSMLFEADQSLILERVGEKSLGVRPEVFELSVKTILRGQPTGFYRIWVGRGRILRWEE